MNKVKTQKITPLKMIRKFCVDCHGNSLKTVRFCHSVDCFLWPFRFGKSSKSYVNQNGEKCRQLFDKKYFKKGAKFSPDREVSEYKL